MEGALLCKLAQTAGYRYYPHYRETQSGKSRLIVELGLYGELLAGGSTDQMDQAHDGVPPLQFPRGSGAG